MQITFTGRINKLGRSPGGGYRDDVFCFGKYFQKAYLAYQTQAAQFSPFVTLIIHAGPDEKRDSNCSNHQDLSYK
ncbi:hypothetical protein ACQ4WY_07340 [Janthinobacterium sp. LB2P49]|uniref:hypothetical protein n=1 Tax=Janthinobacterium sp. LB2P49 TaxID=3424198 RepID=UPI003F286A85